VKIIVRVESSSRTLCRQANPSTLVASKSKSTVLRRAEMRRGIGALVFVVSITVAAAAQLPAGSISLGYTYLTSGPLSSGPLTTSHDLSNFNGFNVAGEFKLLPWISGVAEYGATFGTEQLTPACEVIIPCLGPFHGDSRLQTFLVGPRASVSIGPVRPFAHVLIGVGHLGESFSGSISEINSSNSETAFATAFGGGLDYKLIKGLAWRIQADDLRTAFFSTSQHNLRFTTGIVLRF
jgi:opacity protein-like surface antigen